MHSSRSPTIRSTYRSKTVSALLSAYIIRDPQEVAKTLNNFFTSAARDETGQAKPTPDCSHIADLSCIQQNLTPKPPLSLKKTNFTEVKEAMMKIKEQLKNLLKFYATLSANFLTTSQI